jgi:uncharacterized protein YacL
MSVDLIFRLIGTLLLAGLGFYWVFVLSDSTLGLTILYASLGALAGAAIGWVLTPFLTTKPARLIRNRLIKVPAQTLAAGLIGLVIGLVIAALISIPLSSLPGPFGNILPILGLLLSVYVFVALFVSRQNEIFDVFRPRKTSRITGSVDVDHEHQITGIASTNRIILLDTSVIIDGRIADIARTGFLVGTLLIPRFVLDELQHVADSPDGLRRQRGPRGMDVLSQLQKDSKSPIQISDLDVEGVREVDSKLVTLAQQLKAMILTNDYNLNRVAELQGVTVLNINDLANAVKTVLLPGETLTVILIQEGREAGQGIAYLDDGTMVVVEDGRERIGSEVNVTVSKILQTSAGRMVFARLDTNS